jgi:hypothetical protein
VKEEVVMKRTVLFIAMMTNLVSVGQQEQTEEQAIILKRIAASMAAEALEKQRKGETEEEKAAFEKRQRERVITQEQQEQERKRQELLANEKQMLTQKRLAEIKALAAVKGQGKKSEIVRLLIETAATATGKAYVEVRDEILGYGKDYHALLAAIAVDEVLPWQQQLVARICYERIERKEDTEKLLETNWHNHPDFNPGWNMLITGPDIRMGEIVIPDLKDAGLWYYYLELIWKMTGEKGGISEKHIPDLWARWCALAIKDNIEERVWFLRVCVDLMTMPSLPSRVSWLQSTLLSEEKPDAAYVLENRAPPPIASEPPFRLGTKIIKPAQQQ